MQLKSRGTCNSSRCWMTTTKGTAPLQSLKMMRVTRTKVSQRGYSDRGKDLTKCIDTEISCGDKVELFVLHGRMVFALM